MLGHIQTGLEGTDVLSLLGRGWGLPGFPGHPSLDTAGSDLGWNRAGDASQAPRDHQPCSVLGLSSCSYSPGSRLLWSLSQRLSKILNQENWWLGTKIRQKKLSGVGRRCLQRLLPALPPTESKAGQDQLESLLSGSQTREKGAGRASWGWWGPRPGKRAQAGPPGGGGDPRGLVAVSCCRNRAYVITRKCSVVTAGPGSMPPTLCPSQPA